MSCPAARSRPPSPRLSPSRCRTSGHARRGRLNQLIDADLEPGERTDAFDDEVAGGRRHQHRPRGRHRGRPRHRRRLPRVPRCRADTDPRAHTGTGRGPRPPRRAGRGCRQQLLDAGLEPGERTDAFDNEVAAGAVISTDPPPAPRSRPARRRLRRLARCRARRRCPTLRGVAAEDAVNQLLDAGLEPGERTDAFDDEVAAGAVVSTDPGPAPRSRRAPRRLRRVPGCRARRGARPAWRGRRGCREPAHRRRSRAR